MKWIPLLPMALLLGFALVPVSPTVEPWNAAGLLGSDEFGRDQLLVMLSATGRSMATGILLAGATIFLSLSLSFLLVFRKSRILAGVQMSMTQVLESVPAMIWVLAAFSASGGSSPIITGVTFVVAMMPFAVTIISGEFSRLAGLPYMEAARLLGVPAYRQLRRHLLPNCRGVLGPLFIQIVGLAIAIQGAIGLLGFANRTDLDLGILLLRGKENVAAHPELLLSTLASLALLYLYLNWLRIRFDGPDATSRGFA